MEGGSSERGDTTGMEEIDLGASQREGEQHPAETSSQEQTAASNVAAAGVGERSASFISAAQVRSTTPLSIVSQSEQFVSAVGSEGCEEDESRVDTVPEPTGPGRHQQQDENEGILEPPSSAAMSDALAGDNDPMSSAESAEELKKQGNARFAEGEYEESAELYTKAIQLDEENATLFSNRSAAFFKLGRFEEARGDAEATIGLRPTWSKGYWRKANVEMAEKRFDVALEVLDTGLMYNAGDEDLINARKLVVASLPTQADAGVRLPGDPDKSTDEGDKDAAAARSERDGEDDFSANKKSQESKKEGLAEQIREILGAGTHYDVLGVGRTANVSLIKSRYYRLARDLHPDKCRLDSAEAAMQCVTAAYGVLTSPVKKQLYDRYLTETSVAEQADGSPGAPDLSYAEWESRQSFNMLPPLLACILRIPVFGWAVGLTLFVLMLPVLLMMVVMYVLLYVICLPYRLVLMCCCPDQYNEMREHEKKQEAKWEEEEQYKRFAHV